mgnify:CR=1 FL=1
MIILGTVSCWRRAPCWRCRERGEMRTFRLDLMWTFLIHTQRATRGHPLYCKLWGKVVASVPDDAGVAVGGAVAHDLLLVALCLGLG